MLTVCSPRQSKRDISEGTDLIVQRATQQDVYLRYQSASDMKEELEYVASEEDVRKPGFRWLELSVGVLVTFLSVGAWFAYSKFVEMRNDNEIQLKTNQQERAILQRRLDEVKKREESLKKANEAKFEKMMREQSRGLSPVTPAPISSGGQSSDEFSGMLDELKNKPSATMAPPMCLCLKTCLLPLAILPVKNTLQCSAMPILNLLAASNIQTSSGAMCRLLVMNQ
ncbi:MAG: hypothetical protein IPI39_16125 [Candidatus Obscuribacter sp.]|nr:hypothetical protein [Candidatus Obscuribacter sp.]